MNKLLYLSDDDLQSQLATRYNLLVNIGIETFQYAVIDKVNGQVKALAEYEIENAGNIKDLIKAIEELPESSRQFKYSFKAVKISFKTCDHTFIPAELYDEGSLKEYGKYISLPASSEIFVNNLLSAEIKSIVAIDSDFNNALNRIFHRPRIFNQSSPFLEGVQSFLKREHEVLCFMDINSRSFQITFFKDFKLEFYNSFEYDNADEFNYYLLNIIESQNIDTEQTPIIISGKITSADEAYKRIEKYFQIIKFAETEHITGYPDKGEKVEPHAFFTLFSLDLCE